MKNTILLIGVCVVVLMSCGNGVCGQNYAGVTLGGKMDSSAIGIRYLREQPEYIVGLEYAALFGLENEDMFENSLFDKKGDGYYLTLGKKVGLDLSVNLECGYVRRKERRTVSASQQGNWIHVEYDRYINESIDIGGSISYFLRDKDICITTGYTENKGVFVSALFNY